MIGGAIQWVVGDRYVTAHRANAPSRETLRPPQFGLRTLLLVVTMCGVLFALHHWGVPAITIVALALLAASIFCHVAGNAIGTRLRSIGDIPDDEKLRHDEADRSATSPQNFAPPTKLSQRQSLGWTIVIASSVGVTAGAIGGGLWTFIVSRGAVGPLGIAIGVIAFAVLGGLATFAAVGLAQVLGGAIYQAMTATSAPPSHSSSDGG